MVFIKVFALTLLASAFCIDIKDERDISSCIRVLQDYVNDVPTKPIDDVNMVTDDYGTVCYGARSNTHGEFTIKTTGALVSLKLKHKTGFLTCDRNVKDFRSSWGCNTKASSGMTMATVITTSDDHVILPKPGATVHNDHWFYKLPKYDVNSPEIVFMDESRGIKVKEGEVMKIWYGEDISKFTTHDNDGTHCVRVIANIRKEPTF